MFVVVFGLSYCLQTDEAFSATDWAGSVGYSHRHDCGVAWERKR